MHFRDGLYLCIKGVTLRSRLIFNEASFGYASLSLMAFSLNRAQIIGNLTRDPEVRVAGSAKVATFGVATSMSWIDKASGQKKEKTEFHNVVAWRGLAEVCEQYLRKGMKVYVEGRLQTRDWEGSDGVKRYKTEIAVDNMIMLSRKGDVALTPLAAARDSEKDGEQDGGRESNEEPREHKAIGKKAAAPIEEKEVSIDDLPF